MTNEKEPYSEEEVKGEVGRSAASGEFEPTYVSEGDKRGSVTHRFKRIIARGPLGRFVRRR